MLIDTAKYRIIDTLNFLTFTLAKTPKVFSLEDIRNGTFIITISGAQDIRSHHQLSEIQVECVPGIDWKPYGICRVRDDLAISCIESNGGGRIDIFNFASTDRFLYQTTIFTGVCHGMDFQDENGLLLIASGKVVTVIVEVRLCQSIQENTES